jgi:hypothetical protein
MVAAMPRRKRKLAAPAFINADRRVSTDETKSQTAERDAFERADTRNLFPLFHLFPLLKRYRKQFGYDEYSGETIDRLLYSKHVKDLRLIASICTFAASLVALALIVLVAGVFVYDTAHWEAHWEFYKVVVPFGIAVFVGLSGVIAWCYKTGSARLGMVDLFACEITTLCRICVINNLTNSCINAFKLHVGQRPETKEHTIEGAHVRFRHFDSSEAYTPIFDSNAKELQNLDVKVVNNVTAFYTYWKSMRDAFRRLADTDRDKKNFVVERENRPWPRAMRNVIYMHFLACESGRKAIRDLIEFQPNNAEITLTIYLSELPAWSFLVDNFDPNDTSDVRYNRLALRRGRYEATIPGFLDQVQKQYDIAMKKIPGRRDLEEVCREWEKAHEMVNGVRTVFEHATAKKIENRAA